MCKIIITDTHFGRYNNSINFLKSQMTIFEELKKIIERSKDRIDLVHLGDVFESRSTISMNILQEVKKLLNDINKTLKLKNPKNRFILVAGNHDFYSPQSDACCSLDVIIRDALPDAIIVDKEYLIDGEDMYVPWYWMNERFDELPLKGIKRIFTHCDCRSFVGKLPSDITMYSGHIHQANSYRNGLGSVLYNLSAPYSLDFTDANDDGKGIWYIGESNVPLLVKNKTSIRYRTFFNDQIFNIEGLEESIARRDNFRLFINEDNRSKLNYIERINELSSYINYLNVNLISSNIDIDESEIEILDIASMLENMIPDYLVDKFNIIKTETNDKI